MVARLLIVLAVVTVGLALTGCATMPDGTPAYGYQGPPLYALGNGSYIRSEELGIRDPTQLE